MDHEDFVIKVSGIGKTYRIYGSTGARISEWVAGDVRHQEFRALEDVSFTIGRGESFALIGRNGSGKSTLLQIVAGVLQPTCGDVEVNGRISALLDLGTGFHPSFTGRENVFLSASLLGLSRKETQEKFDEIASFADIGEYLDRPARTYSTGMLMRLAFSVRVALDPDILIIDEALSVGDFFFQQKCFRKLHQMKETGLTLLVVSHDMGTVRDFCDRALFLSKGRQIFLGESSEAAKKYLFEMRDPVLQVSGRSDPSSSSGYQTGELDLLPSQALWRRSSPELPQRGGILAVVLLNSEGFPTTRVRLGGLLVFRIYFSPDPGQSAHISLQVKNKYDQVVCVTGSYHLGLDPSGLSVGAVSVFELRVSCMIEAGQYSFAVRMVSIPGLPGKAASEIDCSGPLGPISVEWDYEEARAPFLGMFGLPAEGRFLNLEASCPESRGVLPGETAC
jgi:lipopolysaccharide transport system ATP-binding protein